MAEKSKMTKKTICCVMQTSDWSDSIELVEAKKSAFITKFVGMSDVTEKVAFARYTRSLAPVIGTYATSRLPGAWEDEEDDEDYLASYTGLSLMKMIPETFTLPDEANEPLASRAADIFFWEQIAFLDPPQSRL